MVLGNTLSPYFLTPFNFSLMVEDFVEKALMALPMTFIIIAGEIDLSVASVLGLASVIVGVTWKAGIPLWLGIGMALVVGVIAGLLNGTLVTRLGLPSLVVTLGTLALFRGLAFVILGDQAVSNFPNAFTNFGIGDVPGTLIPWSFVVFVMSSRADNAIGFELDVITVVLLGGVNIFGGRGTLVGVILSLFVIGALRNALGLADVSGDVQNIVVGTLLVFSVLGPNIAQRIQVALSRRRLAAGNSTKA